MRALIISADGFEDLELMYPLYRLREDGWDVTVAGPLMGPITGKHGYQVFTDTQFSKVDTAGYGVLVIPGGRAPEEVRLDPEAIRIIRNFFDQKKPVGAICHGAQALISAGVVEGKKLTCWKGIRDDVIAAGGKYHDVEAIVDGNLVTSRMPDDLPAFMRELSILAADSLKARTAHRKMVA